MKGGGGKRWGRGRKTMREAEGQIGRQREGKKEGKGEGEDGGGKTWGCGR